jgi:hypothetical protein
MYTGLLVPGKRTRFLPMLFAWAHAGMPTLHDGRAVGKVMVQVLAPRKPHWDSVTGTVMFTMAAGKMLREWSAGRPLPPEEPGVCGRIQTLKKYKNRRETGAQSHPNPPIYVASHSRPRPCQRTGCWWIQPNRREHQRERWRTI